MKKKIVIITSKSLRHKYFRVFLGYNQKGINVLKTVCEDGNKKLKKLKEIID